jgi:tripartite-type tricarboxylate transporter receptor subunit TctC
VINQSLYPKLGFDPAKFEPIIVMAHVPNALIVNPTRSRPQACRVDRHMRQQSRHGHRRDAGNGTTSHLTAELFQLMAKVKLRHIPIAARRRRCRACSPAIPI